MSENNENVPVQCPNITVDKNDKNMITKDCKLQETLSKEHDDQKIEEFFIIKSPFVIHKPQKTNENTPVLAKLDPQPPPYKCMVLDFLMDEPPEYGDATGVVVNVNEVAIFVIICVLFHDPNMHVPQAVFRRCSVKKVFLKFFAKFIGKRLYWSLFFDKVADLRPETLFKKMRHQHRCFPVNFTKFLGAPFLKEHLRWLLLNFFPVAEAEKCMTEIDLEKYALTQIFQVAPRIPIQYSYELLVRLGTAKFKFDDDDDGDDDDFLGGNSGAKKKLYSSCDYL